MTASNRHWTLRTAILLILAAAAAGRIHAAEPEYCAFNVKVRQPNGSPAPRVAVVLIAQGVAKREILTDVHGTAYICDSPLTPVDIAIGFAGCGQRILKGVQP